MVIRHDKLNRIQIYETLLTVYANFIDSQLAQHLPDAGYEMLDFNSLRKLSQYFIAD